MEVLWQSRDGGKNGRPLYLCFRWENLDSFRSADYMGIQGEEGTLVFMAAGEIDRIVFFPSTLETK